MFLASNQTSFFNREYYADTRRKPVTVDEAAQSRSPKPLRQSDVQKRVMVRRPYEGWSICQR